MLGEFWLCSVDSWLDDPQACTEEEDYYTYVEAADYTKDSPEYQCQDVEEAAEADICILSGHIFNVFG